MIPRFSAFLTELFEKPYAVREMKRIGFGMTTVYNLARETFGFMDHEHFFTMRSKQYGARIGG